MKNWLRDLRGFFFVSFVVAFGISLAAQDWPQILGPSRNGIYTGPEIVPSFPRTGPPSLWKQDVGAGFAGPAVAGDRLVLFHRVGSRETVEAMDANTGKTIWTFDYPTSYRDDFGFDEGPRAVPVIAGGRVFTHGADGMLHGIDFTSGKMLWSVDTRKVFEAPKGYFGVASSPVVDGTRVLVNVGGTKGGIVAFEAATGKTAWTATSDEPSYSAPIVSISAGSTPACSSRGPVWSPSIRPAARSSINIAGARARPRR